MKNIYNISKGQLLTIWIFGAIATVLLFGGSTEEESIVGLFFALLVPFAVIFYTFGWRENRKDEWHSLLGSIASKKHLFKRVLFVVIFVVAATVLVNFLLFYFVG